MPENKAKAPRSNSKRRSPAQVGSCKRWDFPSLNPQAIKPTGVGRKQEIATLTAYLLRRT